MTIDSDWQSLAILHWMAELYVYTRYEKGLSFQEMMKMVSPEWLYTHYSPLHETSLKNAWEKAVYNLGENRKECLLTEITPHLYHLRSRKE